MRSADTPSSIKTWRMESARFKDRRRASDPLSPLAPPKACSSIRALGLVMAALRSPARNLSAPSACAAGSGASLANRMTLRLVRFSLPVVGPAGAVLGAVLPNTLLKSGALKGPDDGGRDGGWALATLLGGSGLGGGGAATCGSGRGAARATVRRGAGMCR